MNLRKYGKLTPREIELVATCNRVIAGAKLLKQQTALGCLDDSLLPSDVAARLAEHVSDNPSVTVAAVISRATTFYFRQLLNCEPVPRELANLLLAGRQVEVIR